MIPLVEKRLLLLFVLLLATIPLFSNTTTTILDKNIGPQPDSVTVYLFFRIDCKICEYYTLDLQKLYASHNDVHTSFVAVFPNFMDKPEAIAAYKEKYQLPFPTKTDYFKKLTKKFKATVTPEVVVFNETNAQVLYQGRIDNTYYRLGRKRGITTTSELQTVLEQWKSNGEVDVENMVAVGCFIQ